MDGGCPPPPPPSPSTRRGDASGGNLAHVAAGVADDAWRDAARGQYANFMDRFARLERSTSRMELALVAAVHMQEESAARTELALAESAARIDFAHAEANARIVAANERIVAAEHALQPIELRAYCNLFFGTIFDATVLVHQAGVEAADAAALVAQWTGVAHGGSLQPTRELAIIRLRHHAAISEGWKAALFLRLAAALDLVGSEQYNTALERMRGGGRGRWAAGAGALLQVVHHARDMPRPASPQ